MPLQNYHVLVKGHSVSLHETEWKPNIIIFIVCEHHLQIYGYAGHYLEVDPGLFQKETILSERTQQSYLFNP